MNILNFFKNSLIDCICLIFPMTLYLIYIAYIKSLSKKENKHLFSSTILLSFLLTIFINRSHDYYIYALISAPLLLSYLSKKSLLAISISIILLIYYQQVFNTNIIISLIECLIYYFVYLLFHNKKSFYKFFSVAFILIKTLFTVIVANYFIPDFTFTIYSVISLNITLMFLSLFSATAIAFFNRSKRILDINVALKQLDNEQKIKASIFKLAHELKNPLAVCSGYLEMIPESVEPKVDGYLNIISDELKRSLTILNDFSSLGKIKKLDKEELDLSLLFEDVQNVLNPLYQENNGQITIPKEDELYICGDYARLKQVLINILKNSLEAKNKDIIKASIKIKKQKNNYKISIADNGKGMTKEELNHIYDMFYTTKTNGSGIGVPFIKEIVDLHGGEVDYKSQKNKGTIITITLPT